MTASLDVGVSLWNLQQVTAETINQAALNVGTTRIHDVAWTPAAGSTCGAWRRRYA